MEWTHIDQRRSTGETAQLYSVMIDATTWPAIIESLVVIWPKFCDIMYSTYDTVSKDEWDVIRCEMWPNSGRAIIYPSKIAVKSRIDKALIQAKIPAIEREYYALPDAESLSFETAHRQLMDRFTYAINKSITDNASRSQLRALRIWRPFSLQLFEFADSETLAVLDNLLD